MATFLPLKIPISTRSAPEQESVARLKEALSDLEVGVAALECVRVGVKYYQAFVLKAACEGRL